MELSLLSFSFQFDRVIARMNAEKLCRILVENQLYSVDLMTSEVSLYGLKSLKEAFQNTGVSCGCLISRLPFYKGVEKYPEQLTKSLEICKELGIKNLMIIPGNFDEKACSALRKDEQLSRAVELFRIAVNRGKEYGVEILFEDTPQSYKHLSSAQDCRYVLDHVEGLGFVFDTANFMVADKEDNLLEDYQLLKDRIRRVHLKDVVRGDFPNGEKCVNGEMIRCVTPGVGIVPLKEFLNELEKDGYDGTLCIEYSGLRDVHGLEHSKYIAVYKKIIDDLLNHTETKPAYGSIAGVNKPVSRIFFGTAMRSIMMGRNQFSLLDSALALGINAFDCARGYGRAENVLGAWMKERNIREKVVILSKCGNVDAKGNVKVNREVILKELEESLKALQTDYIDIYLLHRDDPNTPIKEILDTLNECKKLGKIHAFGVSNWTVERIQQANQYAKENGLETFAVSSPYYGLADQVNDPWGGECVGITGERNKESRQYYAESQMPVLSYSSLGRGFFSGRFKAYDYEGAKKVLDRASQKGYLYEENMERLSRAEKMAKEYQTNVADIAIRYIFSSDMNVFAIMSTDKPKRLIQNIQSSNQILSKEEVAYLEENKSAN